MNNLEQNLKDKGKPLLIFFAIILVIAGYQFFFNRKIKNEGVYTKCVIINSEGYKGGIIITIKYAFKGKEYTGRMNSELSKNAIGNQYFIKVLPKEPEAVIFLKDNPVPDCFLSIVPPPEGWGKLPECE